VCVHDVGGLCNRIFPFANLVAFAAERDAAILNPAFVRHAHYFIGTKGGTIPTFPPTDKQANSHWKELAVSLSRFRFRVVNKFQPRRVISLGDDEPLRLDDPDQVARLGASSYVRGTYIIDRTNFPKHADIIREYFRPVQSVQQEVEECLREARSGCDILVGVHIRQGDYREHYHGLLFYETSEYLQLMEKVQDQLAQRRVRFLVCSDVPQDSASFGGLDCVSGPGTELGDLYSLAACDYLVGPASTYSQWAAFYGQVPRYVHNRKVEERYGQPTQELALSAFQVHRNGYGRFTDDD